MSFSEAARLISSAKSYVQQGQADEALKAAEAALESYKVQHDARGVAKALSVLISASVLRDGPAQAMSMIRDKFARSDSGGDTHREKILQAAMQKSLADVHLAQGAADKAIAAAAEAQALFDAAEDSEGSASALITAASAHRARDEHAASVGKALQAVEVFTRIGDMAGEATAWLAVMAARIALGKYEDGMKAAEAALVLHIKLQDEAGKAFTLLRIAEAHLGHGMFDKSLKAGGMALEIFRKMGCRMVEAAALDVVVNALIAQGSVDDALRAAKTGVSMLQKAGASDAAALAMKSTVAAHRAKGDNKVALTTASDAVAALEQSAQKRGLAGMLHTVADLHTACAEFDQAKEAANRSLKLCREMGDVMGEACATEIIGRIEDSIATFLMQQQETEESSHLVGSLKTALEQRDGPAFAEALDGCFSNGSISAEEVSAALEPAQLKDPEDTWEFIKANYPENWPRPGEDEDLNETDEDREARLTNNHKHGVHFDRRFCYLITRHGGMGYGPNFQGVKSIFRKGDKFNKSSRGCAVLEYAEAREDWENNVATHAGMYDQALIAGAAVGWDEDYIKSFYQVGPETTGRFKDNFAKTSGPGHMYTGVS